MPMRFDLASLALLLIGLVFGGLSYWLIVDRGLSALILVPSVVAATTGALNIRKPRSSEGRYAR